MGEKFDRSTSPARWMVLALACITMLGSYYCYDIPSALNDQLEDHMNLNSFKVNMMYSVYSFPNVILPLFGGYFVDKLGTVITLVVFSGFIAAGQAVFALGVSVNNYGLSLVGRVLFGLGGESLGVASSALLAIWFRGKEMAFAMGLNLSISRFGSVVNDYVSPALYDSRGLSSAVWFGFFICCASLAAAFSLSFVEKYAASLAAADAAQKLLEGGAPAGAAKEDEEIRLSDIQYFGKSFWLLTASCLVVYGTILPFNIIAGSFLQDRFGYSLNTADRIMSIPFFISACLCPFLGGAVDKWGKRIHFQLGSAVSIVLVHSYFCWTSWTPYPPLVLQGLAYSVYAAALWPSVPFVVAEKSVGTAYGVITAVQNGGLAFIPMIDGAIHDGTDSYHYVELWFSCLGVIAVALGFWLLHTDLSTGGVLSKPQQKGDPLATAAADLDKNTTNTTSDSTTPIAVVVPNGNGSTTDPPPVSDRGVVNSTPRPNP